MQEQSRIDILERIHAAYYQLTAAERKVADYVLACCQQVQYMSISQLAEACGVAEATISRFCRRLKLKGFNAFKIELALHASGVKPVENSPDGPVGTSMEVEQLAAAAVRQTIEMLDPVQVSRAVERIEKARRVLCLGSGSSFLMASECASVFSTATTKFIAVADSHTQMSNVATMSQEDVLMLFSYSGATTNGVQLLELARSRGIETILVTRYLKSPAAKLADVKLCCGSNEGPFQSGSFSARIAQLVVIGVLFQEFYRRNQEDCDGNIQAIASALSGMHV